VGRLSDRFDRRKVLIGIASATALGGVLFILSSVPAVQKLVPLDPWVYVVAAIYGGCAFTLYPVLVAHAQDFATPDQRVGVSAGMLLCFGVGAAAGPAAAAAPMAWIGPSGLFALTGLTAIALSVYAALRMRRRVSLPSDQKQAFVAMGPALKGSSGVRTRNAEAETTN
jgi:MFS family permease